MDNQEITNENEEKRYTDPVTGKFIPGNPGGGRPKGSISVTEAIKKKLLEIEPKNQKTWLEGLIMSILANAIIEKNPLTQKVIWEMIDGKAVQPLQHSGSIINQYQHLEEMTDDELKRIAEGGSDSLGIESDHPASE